ncbi:MAG: hypothetical protein Q7R31_02340 [Candidatus Levybacteria bacterium]|nr:hypothetical protein [Candidatus Levybacteria bacterium]
MNQIYTAPFLTSWPTPISLRQIISWIKGEDKNKKGKRAKRLESFETKVIISSFGY